MKQMADPRFARAIEFMQRDPKACQEFYAKTDPKFFNDFMETWHALRNDFKINIASHMEQKGGMQENKQMEEILKRF